MLYQELKNKNEKEFNDFSKKNMFYAFSDEQLEEGIKSFKKNTKFLRLPSGAFLVKNKLEDYKKLNKKLDISSKLLKNDSLLLDAFICELNNHEFCITGRTSDAIESLGLTRKMNPASQKILNEAIQKLNKTN